MNFMALEYTLVNNEDTVGITVHFGSEPPPKKDCLPCNPEIIPAYIALQGALYQRGWTNVKGFFEVHGLVLEEGVELYPHKPPI